MQIGLCLNMAARDAQKLGTGLLPDIEKSGWDYEYEEKWGAFFVKRRVPNAAGCVYLTVGVYEDKYIVFARILDFLREGESKRTGAAVFRDQPQNRVRQVRV